jgi:heparan sulfate N-deacetylase/N-sulfotransferase NDST2
MHLNYKFSRDHNLPIHFPGYSVTSHHSSIYPVYNDLYDAWRNIWQIKVTSTEEYPHLRPYYKKKGFIYKDIMVLPRHLCGIFTHTTLKDKYPNGINSLLTMIEEGQIFQSFLFNQILIYMTHMTNYGNDRLGLFVFKYLFEYIHKWTNLKFVSIPPVDMGEKYFELHPKQREPLWTNVCEDKRHLNIWWRNKTSCQNLPKFIIIGPQKTGNMQLYYANI